MASDETPDLLGGDRPRIARAIDYETTGTPKDEGAEVIELGRVDVDLGTLEVGNAWSALARPLRPIPPVTKAVHHIIEADVADAPPAAQLWRPFFEGCGPRDILAAHNADFERHFHHGNDRPWICTYKCARVVWPDAPGHGNQALRYWLEIDELADQFDPTAAMPPHRALPDAYVTAFILRELLRHKTADELVEISKWPALLRRLTFGKHKGMLYEEVPLDTSSGSGTRAISTGTPSSRRATGSSVVSWQHDRRACLRAVSAEPQLTLEQGRASLHQ